MWPFSDNKLITIASKILSNIDNGAWWRSQFAHRILAPAHQQIYSNNQGVKIQEEDWDNLFILDACRADLFEEVAEILEFDSYEARYSMGSGTREWIRKNFSGPAVDNVVYVTASPVVSRHIQTAVHRFIEVWKTEFDPELATVPPEAVAKAARDARQAHPNKRIIVHFLQPHYPFIGYPELQFTSFQGTEEIELDSSGPADSIWDALALNLADRERCWEGYAANLEEVLNVALPLADSMDGKSVITSDHGNLIGERPPGSPFRIFGHPNGVYHKNLRRVPWAVLDSESSVKSSNSEQTIDTEEQLHALGYT